MALSNIIIVGAQCDWEDLHLQECEELAAVAFTISMDVSMDGPDGTIQGGYGQRNRALLTFLRQLPSKTQSLALGLSVLNIARADIYTDLRRIQWPALGKILCGLDTLMTVQISLTCTYPDEFGRPTWSSALLVLLREHVDHAYPHIAGKLSYLRQQYHKFNEMLVAGLNTSTLILSRTQALDGLASPLKGVDAVGG